MSATANVACVVAILRVKSVKSVLAALSDDTARVAFCYDNRRLALAARDAYRDGFLCVHFSGYRADTVAARHKERAFNLNVFDLCAASERGEKTEIARARAP